jgi:type VI secretion system secreted protein VgrG
MLPTQRFHLFVIPRSQEQQVPQLFPRFTQDTRLLRLSTPLGPDRLLAECLRGEESLDRGYALQISALSTDANISLRSLLGQPALLELLTAPGMPLRPFHGHITAAELVGANGGFARYTLTLEPWCAFLAPGRDSRIFQDKTVFDILDAVFASWQGKGTLVPAWRYEISDRSVYPERSLTCQYQESDLAFARRLMHEEGLFHYFEHRADRGSTQLGSHTLVIADHNGSFQDNPQAQVRFTQPGAVMREDSIDRWHSLSRPSATSVEIGSWDYRTRGSRPVSAASGGGALDLVSRDAPGVYAYQTRALGQRLADNQLQALQVSRETHNGAGTVRTFAPGTIFGLSEHARIDAASDKDGRRFVLLHVAHQAHNNLSAELRAEVTQALGRSRLDSTPDAEGSAEGERPLYRNRFEAIRSTLAYRGSSVDGHGKLLHPRPTVSGQQTALVVGPPGATIHTDRDHRIKVQFHWQRNGANGGRSHSRLDHPSPDGHSGAPGDDRAGTWVRIATPLAPIAGANWGAVAVPRVGSEVLVDFLDGDIDRPVVIGSLYNGRGQADAQYNAVAHGAGSATGNAPAWFPGESDGHNHAAVLSGIKSQAMHSSQGGNGAYQQLVFDDSPGQARLGLQSHAGAHRGAAELNLGSLRHQTDNRRLAPSGFGAELNTAHAAALRAGQGLLLSTEAQQGAGNQLDVRAAVAQIDQSHALQVAMAQTARKHNAVLKETAAPDQLPAIGALRHDVEVLESTGERQARAYSEPHMQLSSPAGIAVCTPADAVIAAGAATSLSAGQDVNLAAQGNSGFAVKDGISLFTYGKASAKDKPNQETGIRLHAASGRVSCQSQSDATRITADKCVTVASVSKGVTIGAKKHVLLTAQGAYLKLEGGDILLHAPGKVELKARMKELTGPVSIPTADIANKVGELNIKRDFQIEYKDADGNALIDEPIELRFRGHPMKAVQLDSKGTAKLKNMPLGPFNAKQPKRT